MLGSTLVPWQLQHNCIISISVEIFKKNSNNKKIVKENTESSTIFYLLKWVFQN
jgi:hypothetical protein